MGRILIILWALGLVAGALPGTASAFDLSTHGYYRFRLVGLEDIDTQKFNAAVAAIQGSDNNRSQTAIYSQQRLRLEPTLKLNDNISIHLQADILDNLTLGTGNIDHLTVPSAVVGNVTIPGPGGAFGVSGGEAGRNGSFNMRRLWVTLLTPGGQFRLGRQPSHWGLGLVSNDGNGREGNYGDTFDRILYLTRVDLKDFERYGAVNFGLAVDFVNSAQSDPNINGINAINTGVKRGMWQLAGLLFYDHPSFQIGTFSGLRLRDGPDGAKTTSARGVTATGCASGVPACNGALVPAGIDGDTQLYFLDLYTKVRMAEVTIQAEGAYLGGKLSTGAAIDQFPFVELVGSGPIELASEQNLSVWLGALEIEGRHDFGEWLLQGGMASGDAEPLSKKVTQLGFRPDFDIGLILFDTPVGTSPKILQAGRYIAGGVPITGNFVNNAYYSAVGYKQHINASRVMPFSQEVKAGFKVISAWTVENNVDLDFGEISKNITGNPTALPRFFNDSRWYGLEVDAGLEARFFEYLHWNLVGGVLFPGGAYDAKAVPFDPANLGSINTVSPDPAERAYAGRMTLSFEF